MHNICICSILCDAFCKNDDCVARTVFPTCKDKGHRTNRLLQSCCGQNSQLCNVIMLCTCPENKATLLYPNSLKSSLCPRGNGPTMTANWLPTLSMFSFHRSPHSMRVCALFVIVTTSRNTRMLSLFAPVKLKRFPTPYPCAACASI